MIPSISEIVTIIIPIICLAICHNLIVIKMYTYTAAAVMKGHRGKRAAAAFGVRKLHPCYIKQATQQSL